MNWKDLRKGVVVYHGVFTHWGRGVVLRVDGVDRLEGLFESGFKRVVVEFAGRRGKPPARLTARELRKNPNRTKMRRMVEIYRMKGVDASIDGDRLIIPERKKEESNDENDEHERIRG